VPTSYGAFFFGLVVGWITYRTLRHRTDQSTLGDIAAVIGAVGGGAVTTVFNNTDLFAAYSFGLAAGFFLYFVLCWVILGREKTGGFME
jgi:uncharacterized membrane protein YeaQ/YmgE (transglycosylase-associated protein family)